MGVEAETPTGSGSSPPTSSEQSSAPDGKRELTYEMAYEALPYNWNWTKKWWVLTVIFLVQTSMNFNTSLYSNGLGGIEDEFHVSAQVARLGATLFLILYAFGCELWAPWSEEIGRWRVMQLSLLLVNLFCIPVALAPNFGVLLWGRCMGGLASAGGSVTLGMVADMFDADNQQHPVLYIVFSSVGGSILGPIVGGFVEYNLSWRWCMWIQLIFGVFVQILHALTVPETRTTIVLDREAKRRRKAGEHDLYGPGEITPWSQRLNWREISETWKRPFVMFVTEPIVLTLSLLSGFSDALIFMQIQSFSLVFAQWNFNAWQQGLCFVAIGVGYLIAYLSFFPAIKRNQHQRVANPNSEYAQYEGRLWWLLFTAPCLPIGLLIFALTCNGPPIHWVGCLVASGVIGIANFSIYQATIDYMVAAYGPYSASATGGNGFSRDFLAGVLTNAAVPFYSNIPGSNNKPLMNASFILFAVSCLLVVFVFWVYFKGPELRQKSPFAQTLAKEAAEKQAHLQHPVPVPDTAAASGSDGEKQEITTGTATPSATAARPTLGPHSRTSSYQISREIASRNASREGSRAASRRHSLDESRQQGASSGARTPGTPSAARHAHHVHHHDLSERLNNLGRIDSEVP